MDVQALTDALTKVPRTGDALLGLCDDDYNAEGGLFEAACGVLCEGTTVVVTADGPKDLTTGELADLLADLPQDAQVLVRIGEHTHELDEVELAWAPAAQLTTWAGLT